ncbi:tether containing UBX domain for GLUT4, partial [Lates japonicus]
TVRHAENPHRVWLSSNRFTTGRPVNNHSSSTAVQRGVDRRHHSASSRLKLRIISHQSSDQTGDFRSIHPGGISSDFNLSGDVDEGIRVGTVRHFVRSHLEDPQLSFYLFITPPKTILDDPSVTLFQAGLFPGALVYFGSDIKT